MNKLNKHRPIRKFVAVLAAAGACLMGQAGQAAEVAGVTLDDAATLSGQPLVLNGLGLRSKMFIKVYVVGLYLPHKETRAPEVLVMPGAKRLQLVMMRDVGAELLADSGRAEQALPFLERALAAPPRPGRALADAGRREEIKALMNKLSAR